MPKNYSIPKPPFESTTDKLLYAIFAGSDCLGYQQISVTDSAAVGFTIPDGAHYAILTIEASSSQSNTDKVIRLREDGTAPTAALGIVIGDGGVFEVKGTTNLLNFKAIGIEAGLTQLLNVQYYG